MASAAIMVDPAPEPDTSSAAVVVGPACELPVASAATVADPAPEPDETPAATVVDPAPEPDETLPATAPDLDRTPEPQRRVAGEKRIGSHRRRLLDVLLIGAGAAVLAGGVGFRLADLHVQTVLSGSMRPTVSPGDLAITQAVPAGSLRVGDIIVFTPPTQTQAVIHRIASRDGDVITTKGDANDVADPWSVTLQGSTGYRLAFVVPFLGWLTELRSVGLIVAGLCVALLILLEIRKGVGARRAQFVS